MNRQLALVFDFDDTLAHDSTTDFLEAWGVDVEKFWGVENKHLMETGWDPVLSYMYQMQLLSKKEPQKQLTQAELKAFGNKVRFYPGVQELFPYLREFVHHEDKSFHLEFYIISSGLGDLIRSTPIAGEFTDIFASEFAYNEEGAVVFPQRVVSFTDKTRYLFQISKGIVGPEYANKPFEVNRKVKELRIPLANMIFIGDGLTDVPCFSLMAKNQGIPLAVYDPDNHEKKFKAWGFVEDGRVKNLHSADYRKDSDLVGSIEMSLRFLINRNKTVYQG